MSWNDRVVWSEGQFLLPQMFQQQERYLEHVMHYRSLPLTPFFWGFSHYNIDGEALNIGKLILKEASGIFPDGTPFNAPDHTPLPPPLTILPEHLNQQICLAVPVRAPNSEETTFDNNPESLARFSVHEHDIRDANSLGTWRAVITAQSSAPAAAAGKGGDGRLDWPAVDPHHRVEP